MLISRYLDCDDQHIGSEPNINDRLHHQKSQTPLFYLGLKALQALPYHSLHRLLSQMTNDGGFDPTHWLLAGPGCNYQGLKCYQPQSYGLSNNAGAL